MLQRDNYFIEQEGVRWAVRTQRMGEKNTICIAEKREDAERIRTALSVLPHARQAAEELAHQNLEESGQRALVEVFSRLKAHEKQIMFRQEVSSCISGIGRLATAIMAGIGIIAILMLLIQYLFTQ